MMRLRHLPLTLAFFVPAAAAGQTLDGVAHCVEQAGIASATAFTLASIFPNSKGVDVSALTPMLAFKTTLACTLNSKVEQRNEKFKDLLKKEVLKNTKMDSLFHQVEEVIHYGDKPGQVVLGGVDTRFLKLVPLMMQSDWMRQGLRGVGAGRQAAHAATGLVTGTPDLTNLFGTQYGGHAMDEYQASVEGSEVALAAAMTAEDAATSAKEVVDSLEAELLSGAPSSGRAKQLRALAAVRTALMTNQRLRLTSAMMRASVDEATASGVESYTTRVMLTDTKRRP